MVAVALLAFAKLAGTDKLCGVSRHYVVAKVF